MLRHNKDRRRIDKLHATNERLRRKLDRTLGRRLLKLLRRRERQAAPPAADAGRD
jgi:hypothetical protein